MEKYEQLVINCITTKNKRTIPNNAIKYATVLIERMFIFAGREINLISNSLNEALYGKDNVIDAVHSFLNNVYTRLNIIIKSAINKSHKPLVTLKEFKKNTRIKIANSNLVKKYPYNFLTMDDYGYRFEGDRGKYQAISQFGDKSRVDKLNSIFDSISELSAEYNWH